MRKPYILIFTAILFFSVTTLSQQSRIDFHHLDIEDGLSQNAVLDIIQDKMGFIWLATHDGLNRYDGYNFHIYNTILNDSTSLSNSTVFSLLEDSRGYIWVGTNDGLCRYSHKYDNFKRYKHIAGHSNSLSSDRVITLEEDNFGNIWIGTSGGGLNRYDPEKDSFSRLNLKSTLHNRKIDRYIYSLETDEEGYLWCGSYRGLFRINTSTLEYTCYDVDKKNKFRPNSSDIFRLYDDKKGNLWIGYNNSDIEKYSFKEKTFTSYKKDITKGPNSLEVNDFLRISEDELLIATRDGLNIYNYQTNSFELYQHNENNPASLSNNDILSLCKDKSGIIWIGSRMGGINLIKNNLKKFSNYTHLPKVKSSLSDSGVFGLCQDSMQNIWIATLNGLNLLDKKTGTFKHFRKNSSKGSISANTIWNVSADPNKKHLYLCTDNGLDVFDIIKKQVIQTYNDRTKEKISHNITFGALVTSNNELWVATEFGLNRYDKIKKQFKHYYNDPNDPNSLSNNRAWNIFEDSKNNIWVVTNSGLNRYNRRTDNFTVFRHIPNNKFSISSNSLNSIMEDHQGQLWIGTSNGLNVFNPETEKFYAYTKEHGLINNNVYGILEDENYNLWFSSNRGLTKFDPQTKNIVNYDKSDGLQSNEFNFPALKDDFGIFYFGGINGFNYFDPDSISANQHIPPVVFTKLNILNKPIKTGEKYDGRVILPNSIFTTDTIEFLYTDYTISFEFAALDFTFPEKNLFAYKMENFENEWNYVSNRNFATYNLQPGEYTFKVKASNNDGVWNEIGSEIKITVIPPFYQNFIFRFLLTFVVLISIYIFYTVRTNSIKKRSQILEDKNIQLRNEINRRVDSENAREILNKSLLLKNKELEEIIYVSSHDLRTPLVNIQGYNKELQFSIQELIDLIKTQFPNQKYSDKLSTIIDTEIPESLNFIQNNAIKMDKLLSGLLLLSRESRDQYVLERTDLNKSIASALDSLQYIIKKRNVRIETSKLPNCNIDEQKFHKALIQILKNAIQYCNSKSHPVISIYSKSSVTEHKIYIKDNGIGIKKEHQKKIFEIFHRLHPDNSDCLGIGLTIAHKIILNHNGEIEVESEEGKGSTFIITLPRKFNLTSKNHNLN